MITLNNEIKELENKEHFTEVHKLTLIVKELLIKATNDSIKNGLQLEEELQTIFKTIYFRPRDDNLCLMSEDADRDGHFLTVEEYEVLDYQDIYIIFHPLQSGNCLTNITCTIWTEVITEDTKKKKTERK